ncbi:hypothetical protein F5B22DRAFT_608164 [Xylaria bambusicola]|uniref:uncharacterized protein n=1 Tax=Xylaria bambusicola TaxID=326684 RepID=UPI002007B011|nr:uncharacterized protein F5B22DRAFT_608164 [Xylaria bambusicola]KAI0515064.1 hypothetical protein F5B22DRAFT_608164 [Xylaria bambusicola]
MPVPNYSVVPITKEDIPLISAFLQASKLQLAINRFLVKDWPNDQFQKVHYTRAIEGGVSNPQTTSLKVINNTTGQAVAHLFYTEKPSTPAGDVEATTGGEKNQVKKEIPAAFNPAVYQAVMEAVEKLEPRLETDKYMELTHLYVEPSSRGQGIGSWLLQIAQEAAEAAKLPIVLCSEPNHHDFFVNRGFKDVKHADIDLAQWAASWSGYGVFRITRMKLQE